MMSTSLVFSQSQPQWPPKSINQSNDDWPSIHSIHGSLTWGSVQCGIPQNNRLQSHYALSTREQVWETQHRQTIHHRSICFRVIAPGTLGLYSGGSKGVRGTRLPLAQNFLIFMQFSGKIGQIIGWRPPLGLAPPPMGNPGSATAIIHICGFEHILGFVHIRQRFR